MDPLSIISHFMIEGNAIEAIPFGNGHINDSYKITVDAPGNPGYLLQKINHTVFTNVPALMDNIRKVTEHLQAKAEGMEVLSIIPTRERELFLQEGENYWRVYEFIEGARSLEKADTEAQSYEAGRAFGLFLRDLEDLPADDLHITIPDFHNLSKRLQQFWGSLAMLTPERSKAAIEEITFVNEIASDMEQIYLDAQELPLRITHNDTKFNNLLLDRHGKVRAVIDLDTVMPGYVFYDMGDSIRTGAMTADEDEKDLSLVMVDDKIYESFFNGYLDAAGMKLTHEELLSLPKAGAYMAFIMGVRFLTDFNNGDIYYKTRYPEHNLDRARCQLHVCRLLLEKAKEH